MQKIGNNRIKLTILILMLVIIILIGIIKNTNTSNMINIHEKNKGQQLDETTEDNSYVKMQTHLSEVKEKEEKLLSFKNTIANAITDTGITTSKEADAETMASNIANILKEKTKDATATADDIVSGKTAYVDGQLIKGSRNNNFIVNPFTADIYVTQISEIEGYSNYPVTISNPGYTKANFVFSDLYQRMQVYFDNVLYFTFTAYDSGKGTKTLSGVDISGVNSIKFVPVYTNQINRVHCNVTMYN